MSVMASESVFLSALQPNNSVTTYGLPSEVRLEHGGSHSDQVARSRRVQQQVQMRLAEKSTLPRQNGSASHSYAMSGKAPAESLRSLFSEGSVCLLCDVGRFPVSPGADLLPVWDRSGIKGETAPEAPQQVDDVQVQVASPDLELLSDRSAPQTVFPSTSQHITKLI